MISIVIPAHNESSVIARTLEAMTNGAALDELDVVVVCNGCTDCTAAIARSFGRSVRVIETSKASKSDALNLGDQLARSFPRIYSDADIVLTVKTIRALVDRLKRGDVHAVAPMSSIDLGGCSWPVAAYYDIRSRLPSGREGIGGSGVYALSESGRRRFHEFPKLTADDGFVRIQFRQEERETVASVYSTVFAPRALADLVRIKTRSHYGSLELARLFPELWKNRGDDNKTPLLDLFKSPWLWPKLLVYCLVTVAAKRSAKSRLRAGSFTWQRDDTSRVSQHETNDGKGFQL